MFLLSGIWARIAPYVLGALAVIGLLFGVYRSGKKSAQVDAMADQLENVKVRDEVESDFMRSDDSERKRLRDKWTR